MFLNYLFNQ